MDAAEKLDEIRARVPDESWSAHHEGGVWIIRTSPRRPVSARRYVAKMMDGLDAERREFIATAPDDIRYLLDLADKQRRALEGLIGCGAGCSGGTCLYAGECPIDDACAILATPAESGEGNP